VGHHPGSDPGVVLDQLPFGDAIVWKQNLLRPADFDLATVDAYAALQSGHA
jgi:hypothetical protein